MNPTVRTLLRCAAPITLALSFLMTIAAQTPPAAPSGATGICKDGSYSTAPSKDGACRGHKGVQTWYNAAVAPAPSAGTATRPAPPQPASPTAKTPALPPANPSSSTPAQPSQAAAPPKPGISAERAKLTAMQPAPGGGPGLVWLNGSSSVYHCPGSEFYGKTKKGSYLSEADAKAKGAHPDHNKPCS